MCWQVTKRSLFYQVNITIDVFDESVSKRDDEHLLIFVRQVNVFVRQMKAIYQAMELTSAMVMCLQI